jgi:hypothetical protein
MRAGSKSYIPFRRVLIMMKNWMLAAALLSLGVSISCSSARSPVGPTVSVNAQFSTLYVGEPNVQITATVNNTSNTAVAWTLTDQNGAPCTDPATCGTLSSTSANPVSYTAPGSPTTVNVVATSQADPRAQGSAPLTIAAISVQVTPYNTFVGSGLQQQFTAVVIPDQAPQAVTWSASCGGCINANGKLTGPGSTGQITVTATAAAPLSGSVSIPATVVSSRLPAGNYAFRFSGYDVNTNATAAAGILTVAGGAITGAWDEVTANGVPKSCTFSNGSFTAVSNNQGKLALPSSCEGGKTRVYNVVFDAAGDIQMIEAGGVDGVATCSGVIEPVTGIFNLSGATSFVFGFTGFDAFGNRTGYAGVLPMDGSGHIGQGTPGLIDINDNGTVSTASDIKGTYSVSNGVGSMTLTSSSLGNKTFVFDLFVVSGQANTKNPPLTLYAISTDSNPGVAGTVVFQDPKIQSDSTPNDQLSKNSIAALTGFDPVGNGSNVSLSFISSDKKGNIFGNFDQNDAGTLQSPGFNNTYCSSASGSTCANNGSGRYIINLLGNASGSPTGLPFVLFLSAANTGFLLDQSSTSVMTGTLAPQIVPTDLVTYAPSELPSTFAAATTSCGVSDPNCALVANLLLTWGADGSCNKECVSGAEWAGAQSPTGSGTAVAGTYTLAEGGAGGTGSNGSSVALTTPANQTFVIYMLDVFDNVQPTKDTSHFLMLDITTNNGKGVTNGAIINVQQ